MIRRRALLLAIAAALLPAAASAAPPVCSAALVKRAEKGSALTWAEHDSNVQQTRLICSAEVEDFPTALADGCLLEADGGEIVCGAGGSGSGDITAVGDCSIGVCFAAVAANRVLASPSGSTGAVSARALVSADIPALPYLSSATAYAGSASQGGAATTASALAANPADCGAGLYATAIAASGDLTCAQVAYSQLSGAPAAHAASHAAGQSDALSGSLAVDITGNAATTTALAANGANCSPGNYPLGVSASGAAEDCTAVSGGVTDHGDLTGLADDDHAQYVLLAGRGGGQTLNGGTGASDRLVLDGSSGTAGNVAVDASGNVCLERSGDTTWKLRNVGSNRAVLTNGTFDRHGFDGNDGDFVVGSGARVYWSTSSIDPWAGLKAGLASPASRVVRVDDALRLNPRSTPPLTCNSSAYGTLYFDDSNALCVCASDTWQNLLPSLGGSCS